MKEVKWTISMCVVVGSLAMLGGCGDATECGEGTELEDGRCVAVEQSEGVECGDRTVLSDGACVPEEDVECADGTTEDDESCVPSEDACGEGAVFDADAQSCVAESQIECGEGTVEDDGVCVASEESLDRPEGAEEMVSDEDLERIEQLGFPVYGGDEPPDVSGRYLSENAFVIYDSTDEGWIENPGGRDVCDAYWTYEPTGEEAEYETSREFLSCDGGYEDNPTYASGADDCFTLYSVISGTFDGCETDTANVRSGCLTDEGIADTTRASIVEDYEGDSCEDLIDEGRLGGKGEIRLRQEGIMVRDDE